MAILREINYLRSTDGKNKLQLMVIRKKIANKEIGNALDKNYVDNQNEKF